MSRSDAMFCVCVHGAAVATRAAILRLWGQLYDARLALLACWVPRQTRTGIGIIAPISNHTLPEVSNLQCTPKMTSQSPISQKR